MVPESISPVVYVWLEEIIPPPQAFPAYQAYPVLVVPPGSLPLAVKTIEVPSIAVPLRLYAVGMRLFHI